MNSEPIREQSGEQSQPDSNDPTQRLTDEQRAFASVLGHALAEAWRRKWRQGADDSPVYS